MTCVIAHRDGWTVADTRGMQGPQILPCVFKKVVRVGPPGESAHTLIGIAGQASVIHDFEAVAADAGEDVNKCAEIFRQIMQELKPECGGSCLLVNNKREMYMLDSLGASSRLTPETEFEVIGSGQDVAYGYLYRCQQQNGHVTQEDAMNAIRAASTRDVAVGPDSILETLHS